MEGGYNYPQAQQDMQFFSSNYGEEEGADGLLFNSPSAEGGPSRFSSYAVGIDGNTSGFEEEPPLLEGTQLSRLRTKSFAHAGAIIHLHHHHGDFSCRARNQPHAH